MRIQVALCTVRRVCCWQSRFELEGILCAGLKSKVLGVRKGRKDQTPISEYKYPGMGLFAYELSYCRRRRQIN